MTESRAQHGPGRGARRAGRLAMYPPSQVIAPYRDVLRHLTSSVIASIPLLVAIAKELDLANQLPWLAGALATVAAVSRVMNTPQGERFIARFMPWLAAEDYDQPPGRN